jgi:hypothetical protein
MMQGTLITISRKTILASEAAICVIALVLVWVCSVAQAQADTTFSPTGEFGIPAYNGTISFATGGSYTRASLENGTWNFVNLSLNDSGTLESFKVSAQDSNVTVTSYRAVNVTGGGERLSYTVVGRGKQTFNLGLSATGGEWDVVFNNVFIAKNDGWSISPDATLTITGATSNVTILYLVFPNELGGNGNSPNQSIYQQHSVFIITAAAVLVAVASAVIIKRRNQSK